MFAQSLFSQDMFVHSLLAAVGLAVIHLISGRLRFLKVIPRSRWLSIAGGVAVAYVLLHLLPELQSYDEVMTELDSGLLPLNQYALDLLILLGLIVFYGLEKVASETKRRDQSTTSRPAVFWLHITSYGTYNALIGYLLVQEDRGWQSLILFFIGIGLHFVVNDHSLYEHHKHRYQRIGRWLLSGAILLGWAVGISAAIHEAITASVIAFLTGGILLNTFKEELPEERESQFWAFVVGALGYAAILVAI